MKRAEEEDTMVVDAIGLVGSTGFGWRWGARGAGRGGGRGGRHAGSQDKPDEGLAEDCGGDRGGATDELMSANGSLRRTFSRIVDELHHQYALRLRPDGCSTASCITIDVHVTQAGAMVRAPPELSLPEAQ
jgi:hypothetical protein